jgi:hypothetical protein
MADGFGFPTIENHWSNFIKNHFFRQKAFPSPRKLNFEKFERTNNRLKFLDPGYLKSIFDP